MSAKHTIAYKMARTIVLLTLCLGFVLGSLQVAWDYQQRLESFNRQVEHLIGSVEKAAIKAVYTFDTGLAREVASGLFEFPPISHVVIRDEQDAIMATLQRYRGQLPHSWVSDYLFNKQYTYRVPLHLEKEPDASIGSLRIQVTPHDMAEAFLKRGVIILSSTLVQSFIIAIFLFYVFHNRVTRPLQILAQDFSKITPETPEKNMLSLTSSMRSTEFEEVTSAGNNMLTVIGSYLTAKDTAEADLTRQKNETERFLQIAEAIILQLDKNGCITMINQRGLEVMGYQENELIGQNWFETAIPPEMRLRVQKVFSDLFEPIVPLGQKQHSSYFENDIITKNGHLRRVYWHNALETDREGNVIGILSSGQDITARKDAEDALKVAEGSLRAIIEATSEGFAITDLKRLELVDINTALHEMLGFSRADMLFQPIAKFIHPNDRHILDSYHQEAQTQVHRSFELRMLCCDGSSVPVEINVSTLPSETSQTPCSVAFITDITKRREQEKSQSLLEKQLRQAQKMETIGTLAGGIAHDFNNILTPILGYSSLISSRIPKDDPNYERMLQIAKSAKRGADIIKQILTFSRRSESERKTISLSPVVQDAMQLVKATTPANIDIELHISQNCPPVVADNTQIQQLVLNLCTNAAQAMTEEGGTLKVEMGLCDIDEKLAKTSLNLHEGPHIRITIEDNGHGMDEKTANRIFDPFYTTKESGKGTGLGLAMVHAIIQEHKGEIFVETTLGHGTIFTTYLPVSCAPVEENITEHEIESGNNECALIVDDEALNTNFLEELLEEVGYQFESYNNSMQALDAFTAEPNKYNIVLTDQTMPKLKGHQLAKAIREIRPEIPIIMMSGYDQNVTAEEVSEFDVDLFIQKPVPIDKLTHAMHQLLNEKREES
ncbi:putative Histidine kinase [Candidatus Terasakiella magnetica]|uniref:histidine kinase n=1 Tax=Candidatus Terasakiella magnetica TaxID=1867952 RepID=A0A1C3RJP2_9PROT|nr:PAS domain-containing sensor histidine kinase [Candidatus Terasakiella magnetica]SCA57471.1 putative Histidine kinase [Candidatus Terasakiella magnetica]